MDKKQTASFLALGLPALTGILLLLYSTPEGLGLSDDSIAYIAGARSILSGNGYREAWLVSNQPVTHFPPLFSSLLAFIGLSGLDPLRGARFLNALLYGANVFVLGLIGWRMTKSFLAGMLLSLLTLANASILRIHAVAMSEPLYIFLSLVSFLTFHQYFNLLNADTNRANKTFWLILTGALTGLAYLTRYAGLALTATFFITLILLNENWKSRLQNAGIFLAGFIPFALGWGIRNKLVADNATNRTLVFHPLSAANIQTGLYNASEFLIPVETWRRALIKIPNLIPLSVAIILLVILIWLLNKGLSKFFNKTREQPELLSFTMAMYIFGYLASIVSSMLLFDASTKFKPRINAPVYISLLVMLVYFGFWFWQNRPLVYKYLTAILAGFILVLSVNESAGVIQQLRKGGQGYASFKWYDSEAMKFLRGLPQDVNIYTNQPAPVYLYTGRPAYVLPDLIDPVTGLPRGGYEKGVGLLQQNVIEGKAVLALFKSGSEDEDVQSVYLQLAAGLYLAHESRGDRIYSAQP